MGESLVEAVLRSQAEERDLELRSTHGSEVPTDTRPPRPAKKCACGCGRPLDPRSDGEFARTCFMSALVKISRASPAVRRYLRRHLFPDLKLVK